VRDAELRALAASGKPETAADLIPAIASVIILTGSPAAGERFIQPATRDGLLDDVTGGGWRLFVRDNGIAGSDKRVSRIDASALADGGAVSGWLGANGVDAVLVRPDHYVFGTASGQASGLLDARAQALGLSLEASA
jgi:3-(3-hydroxy-phenyl)propionate hydroxylase